MQLLWLSEAILEHDDTAVGPFVLELGVDWDPGILRTDLVEVGVRHEADVGEDEAIKNECVISLANVSNDLRLLL